MVPIFQILVSLLFSVLFVGSVHGHSFGGLSLWRVVFFASVLLGGSGVHSTRSAGTGMVPYKSLGVHSEWEAREKEEWRQPALG